MRSSLRLWTPEEIAAIAETAYQFHLQGKNAEALVIFEGLFAIDPKHTYTLDSLAALSLALGRPEDAIHYSSLLLDQQSDHVRALVRRCEANLVLRHFDKVEADLSLLTEGGNRLARTRVLMRLECERSY